MPGQPLAENVPGVGIRVSWAAARCAAQLTGYALEMNDGVESLHFDAKTGRVIADLSAAWPLPADELQVMLTSVPADVSLRFCVSAISAAGRGSPSPYSRAVSFSGPVLRPMLLDAPAISPARAVGDARPAALREPPPPGDLIAGAQAARD
jgi:hypothetical protein